MPPGAATARVLHQPVCAMLGCHYPLVLAGRGAPALAGAWIDAAAGAGCFALLAPDALALDPFALPALRGALARLSTATEARFGLDLAACADPDALRELLALAATLRTAAVCLPAGAPAALWAHCQAAGLPALCRVARPDQARAAQQAGAAILLAEGVEPAQLPELVAAAGLPLLAALDDASGAGLASALSLGAQGGVLALHAAPPDLKPALGALLAEAARRLGAGQWPAPRPQLSSPVCYAEEFERAHRDSIARQPLLNVLDTLLEAERAGARTALALLRGMDAADPLAATLHTVHRDEVHWCGMLMSAIRHLGATPGTRTGDFYAKVMAVPSLPGRLALLNRGQAWVVRKLQELAPRVDDEVLREALQNMLAAHQRNIAQMEGQL
ncbi:DUF6306 domain-containing protein [Pseudorhodoferax sp.]|uniref:DUF6306 domain-containing protein n=1 Tax=Pseudorhodoferax sp. TaxID=1993553 RepID=UPI0039E28F10